MKIHHNTLRRSRWTASLVGLFALGFMATGSPYASATEDPNVTPDNTVNDVPPGALAVVIVPPGCGSYSGNQLPAGWTLDDHSGDAGPLGTNANPYFTALNFGQLTIGTAYDDVIVGNAVEEVICGLGGMDWLRGGSGDDELYGGDGPDSLMGFEGADFESGGHGRDTLYGDDGSNALPYDLADTLQGGRNDDYIAGGDDFDIINGGEGVNDMADTQVAGGVCTAVEIEVVPC